MEILPFLFFNRNAVIFSFAPHRDEFVCTKPDMCNLCIDLLFQMKPCAPVRDLDTVFIQPFT